MRTSPAHGATAAHSCLTGRRIDDAAWTYQTPLPEAHKVTRYVCFLADRIDVDVGAPKDRPAA